MSVITRTKRLTQRPFGHPMPPVPTQPRRFEVAEAPDRGQGPTEAPESYRGRPAEAPDAGESRGGYRDGDYTHGRSQS